MGAGQAGLAAGYYLKKSGLPFIILDSKSNVGDSWRQRWDSLELFTPRPFAALPGLKVGKKYAYYPNKNEIADYLERYADANKLPIMANTEVLSITSLSAKYVVKTTDSQVVADQIIIATGPYNKAYIPDFASELRPKVQQLHSSQYKNPVLINKARVAIVGGGNSATQLAEELHAAGKEVTLISAQMPWFLPKTILGISSYWWFYLSGVLHAGANTWISKYVQKKGDGIIGKNALKLIKNGSIKHVAARVTGAESAALKLGNGEAIAVDCVIWATGFTPNYEWLEIAGTLDAKGQPIHHEGISPVAGVYWVGLPWQTRMNSGIINGVGQDAKLIVNHIKYVKDQSKGLMVMDETKDKIKSGAVVLLDVRSEDEWRESHAFSALHIPLDDLAANCKTKISLNQQVYIYCASGKRASVAKSLLDSAGYSTVNIGGLADWVRAGGDLDSPTE
ncbi:NAD(P)-binding domain-containing protein [Polaromonas sp.]|nr:NAD(P)-binding domain-containing protein [Candidatus Saccharibacteria bacterium]